MKFLNFQALIKFLSIKIINYSVNLHLQPLKYFYEVIKIVFHQEFFKHHPIINGN